MGYSHESPDIDVTDDSHRHGTVCTQKAWHDRSLSETLAFSKRRAPCEDGAALLTLLMRCVPRLRFGSNDFHLILLVSFWQVVEASKDCKIRPCLAEAKVESHAL
jgi:hypothetical protein